MGKRIVVGLVSAGLLTGCGSPEISPAPHPTTAHTPSTPESSHAQPTSPPSWSSQTELAPASVDAETDSTGAVFSYSGDKQKGIFTMLGRTARGMDRKAEISASCANGHPTLALQTYNNQSPVAKIGPESFTKPWYAKTICNSSGEIHDSLREHPLTSAAILLALMQTNDKLKKGLDALENSGWPLPASG